MANQQRSGDARGNRERILTAPSAQAMGATRVRRMLYVSVLLLMVMYGWPSLSSAASPPSVTVPKVVVVGTSIHVRVSVPASMTVTTAVLKQLTSGHWVVRARKAMSTRLVVLSISAPKHPTRLTLRVALLRSGKLVWQSVPRYVTVKLAQSGGGGVSPPPVHASPSIAGLLSSSAGYGQAIVNAAASQIGRPYCFYGGDEHGPTHGSGNADGATQCGPQSTVGFDCTGLTQYAAYQGTGDAVDLIHHNSQQAEYAPLASGSRASPHCCLGTVCVRVNDRDPGCD